MVFLCFGPENVSTPKLDCWSILQITSHGNFLHSPFWESCILGTTRSTWQVIWPVPRRRTIILFGRKLALLLLTFQDASQRKIGHTYRRICIFLWCAYKKDSFCIQSSLCSTLPCCCRVEWAPPCDNSPRKHDTKYLPSSPPINSHRLLLLLLKQRSSVNRCFPVSRLEELFQVCVYV